MIQTNIPSSIRRPGVYHDFRAQVGQATADVPLDLVVVAEQTSDGLATTEAPVPIFSERDADVQAGMRSPGAVGLRTAFLQGVLSGVTPRLWYYPLSQPGGSSAAATWTITVTAGTNVTSGTLPLAICGRLLFVGVGQGDDAARIASNINTEINRMGPTIPFTSTVSGNVVTLVYTVKGVNGNDAKIDQLKNSQLPSGVTLAITQTVTGSGAIDLADPLRALYDRHYSGVAIPNHSLNDITTVVNERLAAWIYSRQDFRFFFMGENGSLGNAQNLSTPANDLGVVVGAYEGSRSLPLEIAICDMVAEFANELPNANLDNQRVALYQPPGSLVFTGPEIESLLTAGCTPHEPDGPWSKITRLVTTYTKDGNDPSEKYRDIAYPRTQAYRFEQIAAAYGTRFPHPNNSATLTEDVRNMIVGIDRDLEERGILFGVNQLIDSYRVEIDPATGRLKDKCPFFVAGPVHQLYDQSVMLIGNLIG